VQAGSRRRPTDKVLERGERVPMAGVRDIRPVLKEFGKKQTCWSPRITGDLRYLAPAADYGCFSRPGTRGEQPPDGRGEKLAISSDRGRDRRCIGGDKRVRDERPTSSRRSGAGSAN